MIRFYHRISALSSGIFKFLKTFFKHHRKFWP
nr:MAG TPA: hypothetical protein [Herelleviridae sp.]